MTAFAGEYNLVLSICLIALAILVYIVYRIESKEIKEAENEKKLTNKQ